jgi:hypothetical protein
MSARTLRRQRILRLRSIEHRVASARAAEADNRLTSLAGMVGRIENLRARVHTHAGTTDGLMLKSMSEMATRLDTAHQDMAAPIIAARSHLAEMEALRGAAWVREESASRLHIRSAESDAIAHELRADANSPARRFSKKVRKP